MTDEKTTVVYPDTYKVKNVRIRDAQGTVLKTFDFEFPTESIFERGEYLCKDLAGWRAYFTQSDLVPLSLPVWYQGLEAAAEDGNGWKFLDAFRSCDSVLWLGAIEFGSKGSPDTVKHVISKDETISVAYESPRTEKTSDILRDGFLNPLHSDCEKSALVALLGTSNPENVSDILRWSTTWGGHKMIMPPSDVAGERGIFVGGNGFKNELTFDLGCDNYYGAGGARGGKTTNIR